MCVLLMPVSWPVISSSTIGCMQLWTTSGLRWTAQAGCDEQRKRPDCNKYFVDFVFSRGKKIRKFSENDADIRSRGLHLVDEGSGAVFSKVISTTAISCCPHNIITVIVVHSLVQAYYMYLHAAHTQKCDTYPQSLYIYIMLMYMYLYLPRYI